MNDQAWLPRLAITTGEPAGIGPEIVAALAATDLPADLIAIGGTLDYVVPDIDR